MLVSAAPESPGPHALASPRLDGRGRLGEYLQSAEAAVVRDATTTTGGVADFHRCGRRTTRSVRSISPAATTIDRTGGRRSSELMSRGYEDAYHQFIEPVVGASGETGRSQSQKSESEDRKSTSSAIRRTRSGNRADSRRRDAITATPSPLTTPIYETTTFVFDNAQEVVAYNEGRSNKYLYSRYTNPTVVAVEQKLAALDRAEAALLFSSGHGATATILMAHLKAGDEVVCGAAIYGGTLHLLQDLLARFGVTPRFVSLEELAEPDVGDRRAHAARLVRVADQPDAALRRHRAASPRRAARAACCR